MSYEIKIGDVFEKIKEIKDKSIDCIITSPPYFNLRDYGDDLQIGNEASREEYIKNIVNIFQEVKRVIKDTGTVWLNLGDTYKKKELQLIPQRIAIALQDDGWIFRNNIIWHKPNAMPQNVKDRFVVDFENIFLFTKSKKYNFEQQREKNKDNWGRRGVGKRNKTQSSMGSYVHSHEKNIKYGTQGRIKRSVWSVSTKAYKDAHFAVFPPQLIETCVLAGCPEGGLILDLFAGSGTTAGVAEKHNRNSILIELNEDYEELIHKRVEKILLD
jgi:DNA modification methylase